jgi:hypothetical protein
MEVKKRTLFLLLFLLILIPQINAAEDFDYVISNSADWRDVYTSLRYASLNDAGSDFLISTPHGTILLNNIRKTQDVRVITSNENPFVFNYPALIESSGFQDADEIEVEQSHIDLISEMPEIDNFIVVSDSYGYNAIAVAPYAQITDSWVFLANRLNIYEIDEILSRRNIDNLIIYGFVDSEVSEVLAKHNPEIIDNEDRFEDNIEIVERYLELKPIKQVVLTNGEFIEREIMSGSEPVLFTGRDNVPDQIRDYLKNSDIEVGVLIGNDLVGAATNIRRSAGISVMVKFARGARGQTAGIAAVEGLDLFPLPTPYLNLSLYSMSYNRATNLIEVTYKSNSNIPVYVRGTITILSDLENKKVGDLNPVFISPGDYKTIVYSPGDFKATGSLRAELFALYGESASSLDRTLIANLELKSIEIVDSCNITREDISYVKYSKQKKGIIVKIKNNNNKDCWVDLEIENIIIGLRSQTIGTEGAVLIPKGKSEKIFIDQELTESDLEKNEFVELIVYSGERENILPNIFPRSGEDNQFKLEIEGMTIMTYAIIGLIIIILILIIILFIIKRREEDEEY